MDTLRLDWQLYAFMATNLVGLVAAYFGLKADNAKLGSDVAISMLTERAARESSHTKLHTDLVTMIKAVESTVSDLTHRVGTLEGGQDEWTKSLRKRTHELSNDLQALVVKVALLERMKN